MVGIGASAGGLAALKKFFSRVPPDNDLAFVVVVHLSPEHESHLADLLQPHVQMPVEQVSQTTPLRPNHVYVIPPNANLSAIDTHLRLSKLEEKRRERAPIDYFFRTLASTHDGDAIGIILTGTGSDGTLGVKDIKAKGGVIVVQDPNEAEYDGMPQSAIATGLVDLVLPVAEMPEAVLRFTGTEPRIRVPGDNEDLETTEKNLLQKIFVQLRARTERDFSRYKYSSILRRITRRMQLNYIEELPAYVAKLQEQPEEVHALAEDLLITVTSFFRDAEVFENLEKEVIPRLFEAKRPDEALRLWSVGCATGEEAYSLAILCVEAALRWELDPQIQIFASDLHVRSLEKAREGFYPGDIQTDVSEERLRRFFQAENGGYRIKKEIRDLVVFAPHNLLGDPPFSRIDLISCRNLLIYLQRDVQRDVIELFHYALKPQGTLLLGSAETIESSDLFRTEDKKRCIFRKRDVPMPEPRLPVFPATWRRLSFDRIGRSEQSSQPGSYGDLHQRMLARHTPASFLISADNKLVHLSDRAGRYVIHPGGELTTNVFKLIREELRIELRSALQFVRDKRENYDSKPISVRFDEDSRPVVMHLRPALNNDEDGFVLVIFEEGTKEPTSAAAGGGDPKADQMDRLLELEAELNSSRQRLQALVEEYETSQEEMRASNEEMQSANEELRSTLEELETSKEELQSINEELQTVNQENRHKVEELADLSGDLQNLLAATDIATLFLDRNLRIMRFTPRVGTLFNVRVTDRSRPISDLTHRLGYAELQSDAQSVLNTLVPIEREVMDDSGNWYLTRVLPYRSSSDRIEGVVITFVDISRRIEAERAVRESENRYRLLVESAQEYAIFMLEPDGRIATWNSGAERIFGFSEHEIVGSPVSVLFTEEDRAARVPEIEVERTTRERRVVNELWHLRKGGDRFWASGATEVLQTGSGNLRGFLKVLRDNSERKAAEEGLRRTNRS
ncbi:MAG: chemotaxis protein CheB [Bryobacteraceae bacterium]